MLKRPSKSAGDKIPGQRTGHKAQEGRLPRSHKVTDGVVLSRGIGIQTESGHWQGRPVFVKTLMSRDPETAARFQHEGQVAASLRHPLVVHPLWQSERQLVFPWIPGTTLRDLARCGPMPACDAVAVTWGILRAVEYLHQQGVVHHDLKPENVMLLGGRPTVSDVRLIDFGMSHARHLPLDIHSGTRMGTPHFMPPEQFQGVRGDVRSDLYSVGVLLFDCLAGHPPYEDALGWLVGISENRLELPGPRLLHPIIQAAIQRNRDDRPQSATQLLEMLRVACAELCPDVPGWKPEPDPKSAILTR